MPDNPFDVTLYSKALVRTGWLNNPVEIRATPRHMAIGSTDLTVSCQDRRVPLLAASGARAVIRYEDEFLMSGYIRGRSGKGPTRGGTFTFTVEDDLALVTRMLGWAVATSGVTTPFGTQGVKKYTATGAAETVAKNIIAAQLTHNTVDPITVAATHGWGTSITIESRMTRLDDALLSAVDKAGVGLTARQGASSIVVDAYQPATYGRTLSEQGGQVIDWSYSSSDPQMTRAIIGGPNTATSREFRQVIDSTLEAALGYTVEGFVDAQQADSYAEQDAAGTAALADNRAKSGFSLTLQRSKNFRYGAGGVHVGDRVTVNIGGNLFTDVLREAPITWNAREGLNPVPAVGERTDDPDLILARFLAQIGKGIRDLRTR